MVSAGACSGMEPGTHCPDGHARVDVVVLLRNSPKIGLRMLQAIGERALPIVRHAITVGLFLTACASVATPLPWRA